MKSKYIQACMGVSMILLSAGFFVRSFSTARAAPMPQAGAAGRYQMSLGQGQILVWDTQTGQSRLYGQGSKWENVQPAVNQLPASPLGH